MPQYKLLALDLDDTLLNNDKEISSENKYWVSRAIEAGVIVIFATGRGTPRIQYIKEELAFDGPMVLLNGAEIWKSSGELLERHFLDPNVTLELFEQATVKGAHTWGYNLSEVVRFTDGEHDVRDHQLMKFGVRHADPSVIEQLRNIFQVYDSITITSSAVNNLEISCQGITKETGVRALCEELGLELSDVMAIGDNLNDLKLLKSAGLGVAMGNASNEIKEIADGVTDTNENSGVAKAIDRYLL